LQADSGRTREWGGLGKAQGPSIRAASRRTEGERRWRRQGVPGKQKVEIWKRGAGERDRNPTKLKVGEHAYVDRIGLVKNHRGGYIDIHVGGD